MSVSMSKSQPPRTPPALLSIDVQSGFDDPVWGTRNNPAAEAAIATLLAAWRAVGAPVFHVQHCSCSPNSPLAPSKPGCAFKAEALPSAGEPVFRKSVNSAFIGTNLEPALRAAAVRQLVLIGLTTDHCVSTTTRMAANLGFECFLVSDATATFARVGPDGHQFTAEEMHRSALASLHGEFATVLTAAQAVALLPDRS